MSACIQEEHLKCIPRARPRSGRNKHEWVMGYLTHESGALPDTIQPRSMGFLSYLDVLRLLEIVPLEFRVYILDIVCVRNNGVFQIVTNPFANPLLCILEGARIQLLRNGE